MRFSKKLALSALLFSCLGLSFLSAQKTKEAQENQLSTYQIENPEILERTKIEIHTNWDFFWGKFISPYDKTTKPDSVVAAPSDWNKYDLADEINQLKKTGLGSGTYRLKITNLKPNTSYAFPVYKLAYTSFSIFADKILIFQSGVPAEEWEHSKPQQYFDTAVFTTNETGSVILTIQVSNNFYRKGGLRGAVSLFEEATYRNYYFRTLTTYAVFSGILIMISVYCLINFLLKKDKSSLYLALLILSVFSRFATSDFPILKTLFPDTPFNIMLRIEYISVFFIPCFMTLYIDTLNKYIFNRIPAILIAIPGFIFFILDFTLPIRLANRAVPFMQVYMYTVIVLDSILFILSFFKSRDFISTISIISLAIVALGATCDILKIHHVSFIEGVHLLMPAFVQFAFLQIVLLAYIQNKNYMKVFELNDYLQETNKAYYRFVPKEFLELLCKKDITEITLGEYKISRAAVLSADIRNFTSTSEKLVPIQVFDLLNSYLRRVAPLIRKYNGVIEKYLGDGIIAIFPDSAESALNCAIEMQEQMIELREEFSQRGMPQIQIGIGIHYGDIVIGTGGNNDRMTEISLSKDIDIAIKTESKTKQYHRPILATYDAISYAAKEAREQGRKFSFYGKKINDTPAAVLFSIYNDRFENIL